MAVTCGYQGCNAIPRGSGLETPVFLVIFAIHICQSTVFVGNSWGFHVSFQHGSGVIWLKTAAILKFGADLFLGKAGRLPVDAYFISDSHSSFQMVLVGLVD